MVGLLLILFWKEAWGKGFLLILGIIPGILCLEKFQGIIIREPKLTREGFRAGKKVLGIKGYYRKRSWGFPYFLNIKTWLDGGNSPLTLNLFSQKQKKDWGFGEGEVLAQICVGKRGVFQEGTLFFPNGKSFFGLPPYGFFPLGSLGGLSFTHFFGV